MGQNYYGLLKNKQGENLSYISVVLKSCKDSSFVSGTVSDENGHFMIKSPHHKCYLLLSGIGYNNYKISLEKQQSDSVNLGTIILEPNEKMLKEVVVTGKRRVVYKNGEYKITVSGSSLEKQPDVYSVLSFLPFVTVNEDRISMIGKGKILILINGREVSNSLELNSLKPSQIKDISVEPHASSAYGSEYDAVIKIKTVKELKDYVSSQIKHKSIFARRYSDSQTADVNIKNGKWKSYISYTFKDSRSKESATNKYNIYQQNSKEVITNNVSENNEIGHFAQHGIIFNTSFAPTQNNVFDIQYMLEVNKTSNISNDIESSTVKHQTTEIVTVQDDKDKNITHNVEAKYLHTMQKSNLDINLGYINSLAKDDNSVKLTTSPYTDIYGRNRYEVYTLKLDYNQTLCHILQLQTGMKHSYIINNGYSISNNEEEKYDYNNKTKLKDYVGALYANLSSQFKHLYFNGGVRFEYSSNRDKEYDSNILQKKCLNVFPALEVEYQISPSFIVSMGYETKGYRPKFQDISPLMRYINAHLYEQGNVSLTHMISNNLYLSFVYKNKISVDLNYYHKHDYPLYVFQTSSMGDNIIVNKPINTNVDYFDLRASYSDKFGLFRFAYNGNFHYDITKLPFLGEKNKNKALFAGNFVNQFDITNHVMLFCNINIASAYKSLGSSFQAAYGLTVGTYMTFCKNKRLTLIISGNDLLRKSTPNNNTYLYNIESCRTLSPDSRNVSITLRYNINKFKMSFKKNNSNGEEESRISK